MDICIGRFARTTLRRPLRIRARRTTRNTAKKSRKCIAPDEVRNQAEQVPFRGESFFFGLFSMVGKNSGHRRDAVWEAVRAWRSDRSPPARRIHHVGDVHHVASPPLGPSTRSCDAESESFVGTGKKKSGDATREDIAGVHLCAWGGMCVEGGGVDGDPTVGYRFSACRSCPCERNPHTRCVGAGTCDGDEGSAQMCAPGATRVVRKIFKSKPKWGGREKKPFVGLVAG